jgi:hypothetical protein
MEPITSFLSPDSTEKRKAATIDAALSSLRAAGAVGAVDEFYPKIVDAIRKGDLDEFDALGGRLLDFASKNMSIPADAKTQENEVGRSIEQLVSVADSRNIAIPPAILNDAANAFVSKDQGAVAALANSIGGLVDAGIKVQTDEQKEQRQLADGNIVLIGSQSGTRYNNMGTPIPFGNQNAEQFSAFAERAYSPIREAVASVPGLGDVMTTQVEKVPVIPVPIAERIEIGANPEAYTAMQSPSLSTIELKEKARKEVRELYVSGDKESALDKINSAGGKGLFGGDYTMADLDEMYKKEGDALPTTSSTSDVNFDSLSPEKKRAYLDSLTPEEKQDFLNERLNKK